MLSEADVKNLRDGDVVLVPMVVAHTNSYFDKQFGMKVTCQSTEVDHRPREEREKGPRRVDVMSPFIHSVWRRPVRVGDWVSFGAGETGKIVFLDGTEATVRRRGDWNITRSIVMPLQVLERILPPEDLTDEERKIFK